MWNAKQISLLELSTEQLRKLEHEQQQLFFDHVRWKAQSDVAYRTIFAIPNGGKRSIGAYRFMEAEGLMRGVPDCLVAVPRGGKSGLFLEFKVKPRRPTKDQLAWLEKLTAAGYQAQVAWSGEEAINLLESYLALPPAEPR